MSKYKEKYHEMEIIGRGSFGKLIAPISIFTLYP